MNNFLNRFKRIFAADEMNDSENPQPDLQVQDRASGTPINLTKETLKDLVERLENTDENAYSCEEVYAMLDEYVELAASDQNSDTLMPLVKNHLDMCANCQECYAALLDILKSELHSSDSLGAS